jgi:hypothetical protein
MVTFQFPLVALCRQAMGLLIDCLAALAPNSPPGACETMVAPYLRSCWKRSLPIVPVVQGIAQIIPGVRLLVNQRLDFFGKGGALIGWERPNFGAQLCEGLINPINLALRGARTQTRQTRPQLAKPMH